MSDDEYSWEEFKPNKNNSKTNTTTDTGIGMCSVGSTTKQPSDPIDAAILDAIRLNIRLKYSYPHLQAFVDELMQPNKYLCSSENGQCVSVLHQYALISTRDPIDMSNQSVRTIYRPNLFIRKNDAFGPWNFNYLLNLLELDYQCNDPNQNEFPKVWKTSSTTKVYIHREEMKKKDASTNTANNDDDITLDDLLKKICRQNNCDEGDAILWKKALKEESIATIEHLRNAATNDHSWEKITSVKHLVKQMIRDYIQLNAASHTFDSSNNPYTNSEATLLADIHRVRRYFHDITDTVKFIPYLDRRAVDLAISEIRKTYDDDGNVLSNIHAYLTTFCLQNTLIDANAHKQQHDEWTKERDNFVTLNKDRRTKVNKLEKETKAYKDEVEACERGLQNAVSKKKQIDAEAKDLLEKMVSSGMTKQAFDKHDEEKRKVELAEKEHQEAKVRLQRAQTKLSEHRAPIRELETKIAEDDERIENLNTILKIDVADAHRKLKVKYGRGLLLYGPPGTGKSELLKRAAIFAGITMTTTPLAAGELNRPYVGETERLLVDIMYRAKTIRYLICAMTIDEIDGLVPKRDNNAQQSKVDGISVLLSHIEGVKDISNLIVFGATNRRNMMDEAFLRRMQAKCFVGRPSPQIRKKMLEPLLCKDLTTFTASRIDFLVKVTTNFSGAAVGALKSSIIVAMDQLKNSEALTDKTLLELADNAAREFSCWFGIGTLPEICRLYPNIVSSTEQQEKYSLKLPHISPSGRILVDLQYRKCLIELSSNDATLDYDLNPEETSTLTLLSRFVNGCSSRNIDTIQIIDMNFLTKHNAFDENQIFELLTTTFLECDEYNRSMLIFDIDSLIMLSVSDSQMSKSVSISNIHLYQFIREKCKTAIVEQKTTSSNFMLQTTTGSAKEQLKEKWMVMIVKHPLLRNLLIDDIEFKKTLQQIQQENDEEAKRLDDQSVKQCPKCQQNYILAQVNHGSCHYHDGFVVDLDQSNKRLTIQEAQRIAQKAKLWAHSGNNEQNPKPPKLMWACCLGLYGIDQPCRVGICGLPEELKDQKIDPDKNLVTVVQEHFMKNKVADQNINEFKKTYIMTPATIQSTSTTARSLTVTPSVTASSFKK
ncbi:unnamed protein product [Rotaria sordida]|uniref:AAA+ ATPase domain-containing protein n=1 Tax=Rotaria sordida TaxID=392033 RepID=A0A814EAG1_9BILA|nr:unnamed protein product [Rotaria sordida]